MNAFFGGSWSGMAMINDLDRHVIDRFLAAPASRFAIIFSQVVRAGLTAVIQALLLLLVGLALGVRVHGGVLGWLVVFAAAALLAMAFAGLLARHRAARAQGGVDDRGRELHRPAADVPLVDPHPADSMPHWIEVVSRFNPVNWGVRAARNAIVVGGHWGQSGLYLLMLLAAVAVSSLFATRCFRSYQRSI